MKIELYSFSKKPNSLAIPDGTSGVVLDCYITDATSVVNPIFKMQLGQNMDIVQYNYAYVLDFNRYYFINDITSERGFWFLHCIVDALGSWRTDILDSTQYVTRSQSDIDITLLDNLYPATTTVKQETTDLDMYDVYHYAFGTYVIAVLNKPFEKLTDPVGGYGVTLYALTYLEFVWLLEKLMTDGKWAGFNDIQELLKARFNPLQYIVSARWYPIRIDNMPITAEKYHIKYGFWEFTDLEVYVMDEFYQKIISAEVPKHPQTKINHKSLLTSGNAAEWYGGNYFLNNDQMAYNAKIIYSYLSKAGWTINSIAAVLGNMQSESSINPYIWEGLNYGNLSKGYGLTQWTPATKYKDWAGADWENGYKELDRILWEVANNQQWFSNPEAPIPDPPISFAEFTTSTETPETLANYFIWYYEHPANPNQPWRATQARNWYNILGGETPIVPDPPDPHPQYDKTSYLNAEPFSRYQLYLMPFGVFPLDPMSFKDDDVLKVKLKIDFISGFGVMDAYTTHNHTLAHAQSLLGVDITLSQLAVNHIGAISSVFTMATAPLKLFSGDIGGMINQIGKSIETSVNARFPQVSIRNGSGNAALITDGGRLEAEFVYITDKDPDRGEPLCQNKKLSDLSGYCECAHVHIAIPGTLQETNNIISLLEGGVFIE